MSARGVPAWGVTLNIYGTEETVRAAWAAAQRRIRAAIPAANVLSDVEFRTLPIPDEEIPELPVKALFGIPTLEIFDIISRNPANEADPPHGHADFFAMLPRTAEAGLNAARIFAETYQEMGLTPAHTPFTAPATFFPRTLIQMGFLPTWQDSDRNQATRELYLRLLDRMAESGYSVYRTAPAFQDDVISKYSFNDNALLSFQEKLKDSIDPNGIISPGRYGIWPANMRNNRG